LRRGQLIIEDLFPGLRDEVVADGGHVLDMADDAAWLTPAGWGLRFPSDIKILSATRDLLEHHVRRRLARRERVRFMDETQVERLVPDRAGDGVAGALVRPRRSAEGEAAGPQFLPADLLVDAGGRHSHAPRWLAELGYEPPRETVINSFLGYASRFYRLPADAERGWRGVFIQAAPPARRRAAVFFPVEGDRWLLTLVGGGRDYPPTDEAGFLDFARTLPSTLVYHAIKDAEPLSAISGYRATENRRRHYERLARQPDNFLVLGDAACAFNPVYGQGMTAAALGALTLRSALREQRWRRGRTHCFDGLARRFQRELAKVNRAPWVLATGEDYRYRETVGGAPGLGTRLTHRYLDHVVRLSTARADVRLALLETFSLLRPPASLFRPSVALRVLAAALAPAPRVREAESPARSLRPARS
jgi:2-polyprenyl-6-methoxyphenol hydroxylase-like FAD-dependent oxidoreductase